MSLAQMTTIGIEKYLNFKKLSLFDNLMLPEGMIKENVVNSILLECGEMEVLYSDADFFRHAIGSWSSTHLKNWERAWNVLNVEYNPLENYDRMEEWFESENGNINTIEHKTMLGNTTDSDRSDNLSQVSAFNTGSFSDSNKVITSSNGSSNSTSKSDDTSTNSKSNELKRKGRTHGNIGVTTSQQMLMSEMEIAKINLYTQIAQEFKKQFCIMIY